MVLGAVVLWFGSYVIFGSWLAIVADSGTVRDDGGLYRSLLILFSAVVN